LRMTGAKIGGQKGTKKHMNKKNRSSKSSINTGAQVKLQCPDYLKRRGKMENLKQGETEKKG